ncbi:MAG: DNA polymerase III subunit gamma/tau [Oligoflexia bacterium]|nr:DNA polymerase III subunit gamma/tau [Oligoflexia bacterium]
MTYQVLARKWRPKNFDQVIGQPHVVHSLKNAITRHKVGHAYLLTGTRGVGKTTIARILAKALRCKNLIDPIESGNPCCTCENCLAIDSEQTLDVLEIDGASNNGVEHIRTLIENVHYLPSSGKYKIYIIDEVHMLSKEAFNALLKTLEAPPSHVVFIFATTIPDKILETILSRCQRFDFKSVSKDEIRSHISFILREEKIALENNNILDYIADEANGSLRDALSLLDQILIFSDENKISEEVCVQALGVAPKTKINELINFLFNYDVQSVSRIFRELIALNVETKKIAIAILDRLFEIINNPASVTLFANPITNALGKDELFWIYEVLVKDFEWSIKSLLPEKTTEIILQKIALRNTFFGKRKNIVTAAAAATVPETETAPLVNDASTSTSTSTSPSPSSSSSANTTQTPSVLTWKDFLLFLNNKLPLMSTNLKNGNLFSPINCSNTLLRITIAFAEKNKIFLEYFQKKDNLNLLLNYLSEFFNVQISNVYIDFKLLDSDMETKTNFSSQIEIEQKEKDLIAEKEKENLLANPFIKEAEKLFNSNIDRVIIKK